MENAPLLVTLFYGSWTANFEVLLCHSDRLDFCSQKPGKHECNHCIDTFSPSPPDLLPWLGREDPPPLLTWLEREGAPSLGLLTSAGEVAGGKSHSALCSQHLISSSCYDSELFFQELLFAGFALTLRSWGFVQVQGADGADMLFLEIRMTVLTCHWFCLILETQTAGNTVVDSTERVWLFLLEDA